MYNQGMDKNEEAHYSTKQHVLNYIAVYRTSNGVPPTVREIADGIGVASTNTVHYHLQNLRAEGKINFQEGKARTIIIVEELDASGKGQ